MVIQLEWISFELQILPYLYSHVLEKCIWLKSWKIGQKLLCFAKILQRVVSCKNRKLKGDERQGKEASNSSAVTGDGKLSNSINRISHLSAVRPIKWSRLQQTPFLENVLCLWPAKCWLVRLSDIFDIKTQPFLEKTCPSWKRWLTLVFSRKKMAKQP